MTRARSVWLSLFLEYLIASLAEAAVALLGWFARKVYRRWKRRRKERG